ncbi:MAG: type II toxin-antitoxin system RelE/ParE family toxin [Candidatus Marinimicrobia bacterium]|nr:type II toxin-antitoxin system RelE/ParE family toxin [Candidatus Neomarinimicrobiota bacterium]
MRIIETPIFTRRLKSLLTDEEYRELQNTLIARPDVGKIMRGSGGIRKSRWAGSGRGKRGSVRIIYYWFDDEELILMLFIYSKKEQDELTPQQLRTLKNIVESELK